MERIKRFINNTNARFQSILGQTMYEMYEMICTISGSDCEYEIKIDSPTQMINNADSLYTQLVDTLETAMSNENIKLSTLTQWFKQCDTILANFQDRINNQWYKGNNDITIVTPKASKKYYTLRNELFVKLRDVN